MIEVALSSSSIPVMFPYQEFKGHKYVDGGLDLNLDLTDGIAFCKKKGFEEKDIIVDAVMDIHNIT